MYGKHFQSMYTGSMYGAGSNVFAVWGYCISHANAEDHTLELNPKMLSNMLGDTEERIVQAIDYLCSDDKKSRTEVHGGRRLIHEGGFQYLVVNHMKYRSIRSDDERREYNRLKKREERSRSRGVSLTVNECQQSASVSASVSSSGIQDEGVGEGAKPTWKPLENGAGLGDVVNALVNCRHEFGFLGDDRTRLAISNEIQCQGGPTPAVIKAINSCIADMMTMTTVPEKPLAMLRAYIRNADKHATGAKQ
jgi:hypothetical protein